jgi:hypothetical protein
MAGAGSVIIFVCLVAAFGIWSPIFVTFVSHYFLTTLIDSSSDSDEVHYPREGIFEWWWKPLLCAWVFVFWAFVASVVLAPVAVWSPLTYLILWTLVLWLAYPMSLASVLYSQHWLIFVHRGVCGRMLQHFGAFVYVHAITFGLCLVSVWLFVDGLTKSIIWAVPAVIIGAAAILLYARHWGRFAWLSLNFLPRQQRRPRAKRAAVEDPWEEPPRANGKTPIPEVGAADGGIRAGPPPARSSGIQAGAAANPGAVQANPQVPPTEEPDEWSDTRPYEVIDDPTLPPFPQSPDAPPKPTAAPAAPLFVEEEDEWAPNKKPYGLSEEGATVEPAPAADPEEQAEINKPLVLTKYYKDRAKKEAEEERQAEEAKRKMPAQSRKTPTFQTALLAGVWRFMICPGTMMAWANLMVFLFVEFILLFLILSLVPKGGQ